MVLGEKTLMVIEQAQAAAIMAVAVPTMAHSSIPTSLPALLQQVPDKCYNIW